MSIPYIVKQGNKMVLMVHDRPYVALAGEVHNSDSSSPTYMEKIWDTARDLSMNTLLLPVSWEMVEPEEGCFDFSVPQKLIEQARERGMHIVFLWFGSWKNAEMMYTPAWVKKNPERFQRAEIEKGKRKGGRQISPSIPYKAPYYSISYLCAEAMKADARAFSEFMRFLKDFDENENTVIAVQVENETGLLGSAREISDEADEAFAAPVSEDFISYMKKHTDTMVEDVKAAVLSGAARGSWSEVFGPCAEEIFSAYYISRFVNYVAEAGKAVYPLPMAVNCWLDKANDAPGNYPSGGPVSRVHEVWDFCAPAIDVYCPDIYVPYFMDVCAEYTRRGNPLFIPEAATHSYAAPRMVYTVGHHHAICYSPFGFDDIGKPFSAVQGFLFGMDVTDPALKTPQNAAEYGRVGALLTSLLPIISEKLGSADLDAATGEKDAMKTMVFGDLALTAMFKSQMQPRTDGFCLCVMTGADSCYIFANACSLNLGSANPEKHNFDLIKVEEGEFDGDGVWMPGRRLNGDETAHFALDVPTILKVEFFVYGD